MTYSSQIFIQGIQARRMRWVGHVANIGSIGIPLTLTGVEARVSLSGSSNTEPKTHVISITHAEHTLPFPLQELPVQSFPQFVLNCAVLVYFTPQYFFVDCGSNLLP